MRHKLRLRMVEEMEGKDKGKTAEAAEADEADESSPERADTAEIVLIDV